jgi:hypothetical protein
MPRRYAAFDLNTLAPTRRRGGFNWGDQRRGHKEGPVRAHFGDITSELERFINDSEALVGAVAWISSRRLCTALAGRPVSLVVNKEWTLREAVDTDSAARNRETLATLTGGLRAQDFPSPLSDVEHADLIDPVRTVGHLNRGRGENTPLMHSKFIVRLHAGKPVAVWSGSLNFTYNAESSVENALEIYDPAVAAAYLAEWARLVAVSEPLEFTAGKADPTWAPAKRAPRTPVARTKAPLKAPVKKAAAPRKKAVAPKTQPAKAPARTKAKTTPVRKAAPRSRTNSRPKASGRARGRAA